jgi:hypothetical protein
VLVEPKDDAASFARAQKDGADAYEVWVRNGAPIDVAEYMQKLGTPIDVKRLETMRAQDGANAQEGAAA